AHPAPGVLAAFARGELPPAELAAVAGHVEACDVCCAALRDVRTDPLEGLARAAATTAPLPQRQLAAAPRDSPEATDLQALLRKRLWFLALLMTGALVANLLLIAAVAGTDIPERAWVYFGTGVDGLGAAAGVVLWVRRPPSFGQLRAIELVIFGALYVQWSPAPAFLYPRLVVLPDPPHWYGPTLAYAVSMPWSILIILYGILIPNTWRRCAAVVGVMAVTPVVISAANGLAARVTEGYSPANFLGVLGFWMAV